MDNSPLMFAPAGKGRAKPPKTSAPTEAEPSSDDRILAIELEDKHRDERIDIVEGDIKTIKEALFGTKDTPGICEQVRNLAKYMKGLQAVAWAIFIILAGMVIADLYAIFVAHVGLLP